MERDMKMKAKAAAKPRVGRTGGKQFPAYKGRGEYSKVGAKKRVGRVPNKSANKNFSSDYGARLGSVVGEGIQSFANALGFGEYNIQQNSCLSATHLDMGTSPPRVKNTNRGEATVFNHREYLGELVTGAGTPSAFTLQEYSINPGNSQLFPFAARLAENFQEWEVRGMLIELKSEASETSTTLNLGSMFCAVDYNSLDPAPTNKIELENLEYACSNKPSKSILMPVECARKNDVLTHLYIAVDEDYQGGDKRLYDIGRLFVGSFGCPAAEAPIAEIWVTYELALFKPHLHERIAPPLEIQTFGGHWKGGYDGVTTATFPEVSESAGTDVGFVQGPNAFAITHRATPRTYLWSMSWRSAVNITAFNPVITFSAGITPVAQFFSSQAVNNGQTYNPGSIAVAYNTYSYSVVVQVVAGATTDFDTMTFAWPDGRLNNATSTRINWDLVLARLPSAVVDAIPAKGASSNPLFDTYIEEEVKRRVRELNRTTSC